MVERSGDDLIRKEAAELWVVWIGPISPQKKTQWEGAHLNYDKELRVWVCRFTFGHSRGICHGEFYAMQEEWRAG